MDITLNYLVKYLKEYDNPFEPENATKYAPIIVEILKLLENMPDEIRRIRGSYKLNLYMYDEFELFYIKDMEVFKLLLTEKRYLAFIHELYDFIEFKILLGNPDQQLEYLPSNIKNALIYVIRREFIK